MKVPLCFVKSSVESIIEVFARREVELLQYVHTDGTYLCLILHSGNPFLKCFEKIVPVTDELLVGVYIVCIQPFGCLPNHIVGKGVIKEIRRQYPKANIAAIDYDPGASEVNQLNRIKLMLSTAQKNLAK